MPKEIGEKKINRLVKKFQRIENRILNIINDLNSTDEITTKFYNSIRARTIKEYEKLRKVTTEWSKLSIPITYNMNIKFQVSRIKKLKFKSPKTTNVTKLTKSNISRGIKSTIIIDFNSTMLIGLNAGQKTLFRLISLTQQLNIGEKQLDKLVSEGFVKGKPTYRVGKEIQNKLMKKALDKKYITIINKNGETEQWQTSKYADLVARTKLSETQSISTINTAIAFGSDLIQISSHNTTSPQCIPFESKIFSISGLDKDFPKLTELNPFHPNCLHTSSVVFREVLEERGLKKFSDFSLGKTQIHPTRTTFIPQNDIKKRLENQLVSVMSKKKRKVIENRLEKLK